MADAERQGRSPNVFWRWGLVAVLLVVAVVRGYRLDLPMERDEGEYAYAGQLILQGIPPYQLAYNMKLPGIYLVFAIIEGVFGESLAGIHLGLLTVNLASIILIYLLGRRLIDEKGAFFSSALFALMSAHWSVTGLFANSEHFVILPMLAGVHFLVVALDHDRWWQWGLSGLLMGTGFVIKQHGLFFVAFAVGTIVLEGVRTRPLTIRDTVRRIANFLLGATIPFAAICLWMSRSGVFSRFWFWTFTYSPHYFTQTPWARGWKLLKVQLSHMVGHEMSPIWLLVITGAVMAWRVPELRRWRPLWGLWTLVSLAVVCPGLYFRGHYFLFLMPVACLLAGLAISRLSQSPAGAPPRTWITGVISGILLLAVFHQRDMYFQFSGETISRLIFGVNPFAESQVIGEYIQRNSDPADTVAVIGSEPQIYFYARRRSATGYIYMYPLMEHHPFSQTMQRELIEQIETARPKFLVYVNVKDSWLRGPEPYSDLRDWYPGYLNAHYEFAGLVELEKDSSRVTWESESTRISIPDSSREWVGIYRRTN